VRTDNIIVKPLVTGCYGSQALTKYAGLALMALNRGSTLPSLTQTSCLLLFTLVVAQCAAVWTRWRIEKLYVQYAQYTGVRPDDPSLLDARFCDVHPKGCDRALDDLADRIHRFVPHYKIPIRLIKPWAMNAARNRCSYVCGLIGFTLLLLR
jgi:hypothetical protein